MSHKLLATEKNPNIHFADNTKVSKKNEVKYIGINLNQKGDNINNISQRIANAWITLQKLRTFWRENNCPTQFKMIALDAVVESKVNYGIDLDQVFYDFGHNLSLRRLPGPSPRLLPGFYL